MVKITEQEILKLAQMSAINISEHDIMPALIEKIDAVLTYASSLKEIAKGHKQSAMPHTVNRLRTDVIIRTPPEPILAQAPERSDNYFVVPVILKVSETL